MDPTTWGPKLWDCLFATMHTLSRQDSLVVLRCMKTLIPCVHCLNSYVYYYDQMPPAKYLESDAKRNPTKWLWVIHDMVNQKLGKQCLAYSRLEARLQTFSHIVSPYDVYDICIIMSMQASTDAAIADMRTVLPLFAKIVRPSAMGAFLTAPPADLATPATLWVHVLSCKNKMHEHVGEPVVTREQAIAQYAKAKAPSVDEQVKKVSSRVSRSSRRTRH